MCCETDLYECLFPMCFAVVVVTLSVLQFGVDCDLFNCFCLMKVVNELTACLKDSKLQQHRSGQTFFRNSDEPLLLLEENRKYKGDDFYQLYPEIKADLIFSKNKMKQKIANFKARDLSQFINSKYTEISGESIEPGVVLRSE